jgi:hypothetical protein
MQVLDQQIAPPRPLAQQCAHLVERRRIDLAALRGAPRPPLGRCRFVFFSDTHEFNAADN